MLRDRQIAVVASILGLAGLIVGIVAISQVSGAEDEWIRNRALPGAASSEGAVLQKQFAVQEVADLAERVAELEKTPVPAGPEEVMPTVEIPTGKVDYADEELDQTLLPADESGVTVELTEELLTPPPTTTEPESLGIPDEPMELPPVPEGLESDSDAIPQLNFGEPAYIQHRELIIPIAKTGIVQLGTVDIDCEWWQYEPHYMLFNGYPDCSKTIVVSEIDEWEKAVTKNYFDNYLQITLNCTNVINHIPIGHNLWKDVGHPSVWLYRPGGENVDYWLAPTNSNLGWGFDLSAAESAGRIWEYGEIKEVVTWDWWNTHGSIETNDITIIIRDNDLNVIHYVDLKVSLSYTLLAKETYLQGVGPARCAADLTIIRSYKG